MTFLGFSRRKPKPAPPRDERMEAEREQRYWARLDKRRGGATF